MVYCPPCDSMITYAWDAWACGVVFSRRKIYSPRETCNFAFLKRCQMVRLMVYSWWLRSILHLSSSIRFGPSICGLVVMQPTCTEIGSRNPSLPVAEKRETLLWTGFPHSSCCIRDRTRPRQEWRNESEISPGNRKEDWGEGRGP